EHRRAGAAGPEAGRELAALDLRRRDRHRRLPREGALPDERPLPRLPRARDPGARLVASTGLILGKFLPPHAGPVHLVRTALAQVDGLSVLVCSLAREPIPGALRHAWMRELFPSAEVIHVDEELPQEPAEDPRFWERWTAAIRRVVPRGPDLVFTSEDYGDELARRLGARHVCVDRARAEFPVSGTDVRRDPLAAWRFLPPPVRAHFVK